MRANYGRPSGNKGPGHDSAEVEQVIIEAEQVPVGKIITGSEYTVADRITQAAAIWNRREV